MNQHSRTIHFVAINHIQGVLEEHFNRSPLEVPEHLLRPKSRQNLRDEGRSTKKKES